MGLGKSELKAAYPNSASVESDATGTCQNGFIDVARGRRGDRRRVASKSWGTNRDDRSTGCDAVSDGGWDAIEFAAPTAHAILGAI